MVKIALIGVGSKYFRKRIIFDILREPKLHEDLRIHLMDWNTKKLKIVYESLSNFFEKLGKDYSDIQIESSNNLKDAIKDAKFVFSSFMNGELDAYSSDIKIPKRYGIDQVLGESNGPGSIFRFLRNAPVYTEIVKNLSEVAYSYEYPIERPMHFICSNPVDLGVLYCNKLWVDSTFGIPFPIYYTIDLVKKFFDRKKHKIAYSISGIHNLSWMTEIRYLDHSVKEPHWVDGYQLMRKSLKDNVNLIGSEKIRWDIFKATGYLPSGNSNELSEMLPYYRRKKSVLKKYKADPINVFSHLTDEPTKQFYSLEHGDGLKQYEDFENNYKNQLKFPKNAKNVVKSPEAEPNTNFIGDLLSGVILGNTKNIYLNLPNINGGIIANLPKDSAIEVLCTVDSTGIRPHGGIELPKVCTGLCIPHNIKSQLVIDGVTSHNKDAIYHALLNDPLTSSSATPEKIKEMMDDLFRSQKEWLKDW